MGETGEKRRVGDGGDKRACIESMVDVKSVESER